MTDDLLKPIAADALSSRNRLTERTFIVDSIFGKYCARKLRILALPRSHVDAHYTSHGCSLKAHITLPVSGHSCDDDQSHRRGWVSKDPLQDATKHTIEECDMRESVA